MAISPVTVTVDFNDFLGTDFDPATARLVLTTNVASGWLVDTTTGGTFRVGGARITPDATGVATASVLPSGATGLEPAEYQIRFTIEATNPATRKKTTVDLGWYTITATCNLKDEVDEQYVPAEYLTTVTDELQTYSDAAEVSATSAAASATSAAASATTAVNAKNQASEIALGDAEAAFDGFLAARDLPADGDALTASFVSYITDAAGDGVTDDAAAIQAVMDATAAFGFGGVVQGDPRKVYAVGSSISQADGVILKDVRLKRIGSVFDVLVNSDTVGGNTALGLVNVIVDGDRLTDSLVQATAAHRFCGVRWRNVTDSTLDVTVLGTVNGETQAEGSRAGVALEDCANVTGVTRTSGNDGTGTMLFGTTHDCHLEIHSDSDTGSGFSSTGTTYDNHVNGKVVDNGVGQAVGTYSAFSVNGPGYTSDWVETVRANAAGLNIGHAGVAADGYRCTRAKCVDSDLSDIIVRGTDDVEIAQAYLSGGAGGGIAGHANLRIYSDSNRVKANVTARDSANVGILVEGGSGHDITADVSGAAGHGLQSNVPLRVRGRFYNNGQTSTSAGVTLVAVTQADLDIECFDDQGVKTQDYGLWLAGGGGSGVSLTGALYDNGTSDIYTTASGAQPRRVSARVGTTGLRVPASRVIAKVRRSAVQSIPGATNTALSWDAIDWEDIDVVDIAGANPTRFTVPALLAGQRLKIEGGIMYAASATGIRRLSVLKNGTTYIADVYVSAASAAETALQVVAYDTAPVAGDYYELMAYQNSGGALNTLNNTRCWGAIGLA